MKSILLFLSLIVSSSAFGDVLKNKDEAKQLAKSIMLKVADGNTGDALDLMKPYLIIPIAEFDVMKNQLAMQAPMIEQRFGKTMGTEFVRIDELGESLMRIMYIQKFEKHLMRWRFYFYKPENGWVLNTFNSDDNVHQMFEGQ